MASSHPHALAPGTRLDAFRIESVLGVGGFGITYAACDQTLPGDLEAPPLDTESNDEVGKLAVSFNRMRRSLEKAMQMLR